MFKSIAVRSLWLAGAVALAGCGSKDPDRVEVYPVSGKVVVNGQPAAGAKVVFYGATADLQGKGTVLPEGETDESGAFELRSYEPGDGAPAGNYAVTVRWPEETPPGAGEMFQPKDRLKDRYSSPETSKLTAEVPEGGVELPPFELN